MSNNQDIVIEKLIIYNQKLLTFHFYEKIISYFANNQNQNIKLPKH